MEHEPARGASLIRLMIVVEGATEEDFVNQLIAAHLRDHGLAVTPKILGPPGRQGGDVTIERIVADVTRLSRSFDAVTTLVDFYGFRARPTDDIGELERRIDRACQDAAGGRLRPDRVFAYVQRHEFEALLFADVSAFQAAPITAAEALRELETVRQAFRSPEDIDDGRDTAPSKRIAAAIPGYRKVVHGRLFALTVGLEAMRRECPRFGAWLSRLEALGAGAAND